MKSSTILRQLTSLQKTVYSGHDSPMQYHQKQSADTGLTIESEATQLTLALIDKANRQLGLAIPPPMIKFDLKGQTAGMVKYRRFGPTLVRYNLKLLSDNRMHFIAQTIPHEVAHVVAIARYGRRIRPHGPEWQNLMHFYNATPERCHRYDVTAQPGRKLKRFKYQCSCQDHQLTSIRHNRVLKGQTYLCRTCATPLTIAPLGNAP